MHHKDQTINLAVQRLQQHELNSGIICPLHINIICLYMLYHVYCVHNDKHWSVYSPVLISPISRLAKTAPIVNVITDQI